MPREHIPLSSTEVRQKPNSSNNVRTYLPIDNCLGLEPSDRGPLKPPGCSGWVHRARASSSRRAAAPGRVASAVGHSVARRDPAPAGGPALVHPSAGPGPGRLGSWPRARPRRPDTRASPDRPGQRNLNIRVGRCRGHHSQFNVCTAQRPARRRQNFPSSEAMIIVVFITMNVNT